MVGLWPRKISAAAHKIKIVVMPTSPLERSTAAGRRGRLTDPTPMEIVCREWINPLGVALRQLGGPAL
jgi:hypothetical protein